MLTLLVIAGAALAVYAVMRASRAGGSSPRTGGQERQWEERILLMTRGNRGALERAVTARRRRFPGATRLELLKMVHDEYVKDRE
ncbi:hypothetical protein HNQ07_000349 [Deinococcus metalli]|uniref:Uncharacterized protein n=1 Tax=Deinococcus metalli TaxID=1141878 RepID=A0A7W8KB18_9DEIO|nr:hypothetical protein [Deinococcus metalli]MBB5374905.1 hypothetical protein [Deinococcus metalli]GHF32835.1 hypothetical protein GCM10017781_06920 [Deinococcus metalli]